MNRTLPSSIDEDSARYLSFLRRYPAYAATNALDALRQREFARLDASGDAYLDYTGGSLYPASLVNRHAEFLLNNVLGNPHSHNNSSLKSSALLTQARRDVLDYFGASPEEYLVLFTANASAALKLVGESYPFDANSELLITADNHNSVQGIREFARRRGACVRYIGCQPDTLLADDITPYLADGDSAPGNKLLAYPAQSNFSGVQHPLSWIAQAQQAGYDVLLDGAAFVPTNRLDLARHSPDFVSLSFYKIFGYPTGVGALIAKRKALAKLRRPWFAGGTVKIVSAVADFYALEEGEAAFEEGTVNYLSMPAISAGLEFMRDIGIDRLHERVSLLAAYLLEEMQALQHRNGRPAIEPYGPTTMAQRGATIAFNVIDPEANYLHYASIERLANEAGIAVRSGCFCNPGAGESSLGHTSETINRCRQTVAAVDNSAKGFDLPRFQACIVSQGKATGAVRISLGLASNFADVDRGLQFLRGLLDRPASTLNAD